MFNVKVSDNEPVSPYLEVQHVQEGVEGGVGVASPEHHRVQGPGGLPVLRMQGILQIVGVILGRLAAQLWPHSLKTRWGEIEL